MCFVDLSLNPESGYVIHWLIVDNLHTLLVVLCGFMQVIDRGNIALSVRFGPGSMNGG